MQQEIIMHSLKLKETNKKRTIQWIQSLKGTRRDHSNLEYKPTQSAVFIGSW